MRDTEAGAGMEVMSDMFKEKGGEVCVAAE
jgi:hypothetical protein